MHLYEYEVLFVDITFKHIDKGCEVFLQAQEKQTSYR